MIRFCLLLVLTLLLASCASVPEKDEVAFDLRGRESLYELSEWTFQGRVSVTDESNAVSGSIEWSHRVGEDHIKLSGPFGQGRTRIVIFDRHVEIDSAGEKISYFGGVDKVVSSRLGVELPVSSLKYWVLGLTSPLLSYKAFAGGFVQDGWRVSYLSMQAQNMPRKIRVEKGKAKLKLIINQWEM